MGSNLVVVRGVGLEATTQVRLAKHDQMIGAFAPSRTDNALDVPILPRRARRNWVIANAHRMYAVSILRPERTVAVADKMTRRFVPRKGLGHLARDPFCRWIVGD